MSLSRMRLRLAINVIWKVPFEAALNPSQTSADYVFDKLFELGHLNPSNEDQRCMELTPLTRSEAEESTS